ncbi:MAG: sigma-70 family RNA polymerase sigma factor [Balneolaceae bacterium]|nr:sigma-70 family RNA polymerase sigma factor [Balneolaceae bacterium]
MTALKENKEGKASELLQELIPRLKDYLKVTMNASEMDAEECIHQAFLNVYEQIIQDNIRKKKYIFSYLLRACRHEYIRYSKHQHRFNYPIEDNEDHLVQPASQISNLLDEERQKILETCLEELKEQNREFIEYFIDKPDTTTKEASKHFDISGANVRTKKSRIISRLHHCFKRKWGE